MTALFIILAILLLLMWFFFSPIELSIDTRFPIATVRWRTIGNVSIQFYDGEFWLKGRIFFVRWKWRIKDFQSRPKKQLAKKKRTGKTNFLKVLSRMWRMVQTFHVKEYEVAISPQDYCIAGKLYPLNYLPASRLQNVFINFYGANYFMVKVVSAPWRMMYAFIRK